MNPTLEWIKKHMPAVIGVAAILLLVLGLLVIPYALRQGVISDGNSQEADISAVYKDAQNYFSACETKTFQSAGIVKGQVKAFDQIISDAVKGRYQDTPQSPDASAQFAIQVKAIQERYPDLKSLGNNFDNLLAVVNGCQSDFRDSQSKLLSQLAAFNKWRTGSWSVRTFGGSKFPNDNLEAAVTGQPTLTGKEALAKMRELVLTAGTADAYTTGTVVPKDPMGSSSEGGN